MAWAPVPDHRGRPASARGAILTGMRPATILLGVLLACGGGASAATLAGERDVLALFAELPVAFVIEAAEAGEEGHRFRLRSAEPAGRSASGALYLRATVTLSEAADAAAEVDRRLAAADPDVGLGYAWDFVVGAAGEVVHLHAGCTFSEESFQTVARALAAKLSGAGPPASFSCRCGGGCRAGPPFAAARREPLRLPPVRRTEDVGEEAAAEYDNRLDPSGSWTSPIGELSLIHSDNRLAFSYAAVFGPTAHICEGAGVAGLVGRDRYEHGDEQGTVAFVLAATEVRMELADGVASFCGAGWSGDRFTTDRFEPPAGCAARVEHTHFHVVDTLDLERTHRTVGIGAAVEAVPARHTGDDAWVLGRSAGLLETEIGLLARADLECPPHR